MDLLEKVKTGMKDLGVDPETPALKNVISWYEEFGAGNSNISPCSMCCDRHREPSMYPSVLATVHAVFGSPGEATEQSRICEDCRRKMQAAEAEYANALCGAARDDGSPASPAEMLLMAEAYERCMSECERIGAEHEAMLRASLAAQA